MGSIDWKKIRAEEFPVLETMTFLDAACVSFAPQRSVRAVKAFADMTATQEEANSSAHHIAMDSLRNKAYEEAIKLFNADPEEIALVESTSHGLNIAARGIELNDGDSIITTNLEFIQVALPWCLMRQEKKIDIDEVAKLLEEGKIDEVWGCGTAAVISPVGKLCIHGKDYTINNYEVGPMAHHLYDTLTGIQWGRVADTHNWVFPID